MWFSVCGVTLDDWANAGYVDVLFTCGECSFSSFGVGLYTLNFLHPYLSLIQQEIFKKIMLIVHIWDERNFYLHFETKDT